jgi:chromosome segregation protein
LVQFTKLRLTGFKSFVDATDLMIEPGMTGIVGPNGCGKSNLVEALRWVMGETSAKRMRGSEMDDVIFAGTANRPARNIAEVLLFLDNADRKVPAQFNEYDDLTISRKIERGEGSAYRVNGMETRAKDVQLLFADAATGAHSTALVSQGRIGAIIAAKPTDRRALLEEAAGITGLHSRRHEAELRLKAAEANLARLDDVIVTLESQLAVLKKQARQASRYRNLQDHIRRQEAVLFHLLWTDAEQRLKSAEEALTASEGLVVSLTSSAAVAATRQSEAALVLPGLRQAEAEAAAEFQRLTIARAQLDQEEARVAQQRAAADRQLSDIAADTERETALAADAAEAQAGLNNEGRELADIAARESAIAEEAARAVVLAASDVDETETELANLTQNVAAGEARQSALSRRRDELAARLERLRQRAAEAAAERDRLQAEIAADESLNAARATTAETEQALEAAQAAMTAAEAARAATTETEAAAREKLTSAQSAHTSLKAEIDALSALFQDSDQQIWPPLVDALSVMPGYEAALGAALGDDLQASADSGAPLHWRELGSDPSAPALPFGARPLSEYVTGSAALLRRLAQVGVMDNEAGCRALAGQLVQGQRLVGRDGSMWRWDGFTIQAGSPTAEVQRLQQRNRLKDLNADMEGVAANLSRAHAEYDLAKAALSQASSEEQARRQDLQNAYNSARDARERLTRAEQALAQVNAKLTGLLQSLTSLETDTAEADQQLGATDAEIAGLPDLGEARDRILKLKPILTDRRGKLIECRSTDDRLRREAQQRQQRLDQIEREYNSWTQRAEAAARHLEALTQRRDAMEAEIARLSALPEQLARQRNDLLSLLSNAEQARRDRADELATAENDLTEADRALKHEEHRLAEMRENKVRSESAVEQAREAEQSLTERIRERLECTPHDVLPLAELDPSEPLPDRTLVDQKLQRLLRERENIGPVNLRAEVESNELDQQLVGMQTERSDLVNAIARLRQGINSLNREGRERLLAAFELVNGHFESLFTRLFGGGRAHLTLTEAEDPLEAGLEILASPPGKKLQVMSLLSGGEQALTALALLFAVFLVNPAPICVLDEVDAPLDDANVERFCNLVEELGRAGNTRFLVITHHRLTMARMDRLFGVTMSERGVSQLVSVDLQDAHELKAAQ